MLKEIQKNMIMYLNRLMVSEYWERCTNAFTLIF